MSDFNSSLPVRTETNGDVAVKIVDGTITSQALTVDSAGKVEVKLDDSSGNGITSQTNGGQRALDVGIDVAGVQVDPRQIRALTSADVVTASNFPTTVDTNYGTVGASTLRSAAQIGNSAGAADFNAGATSAQTLRTTANQGTPNTATNGWPVKPTDGTNSQSFTAAGSAKIDIEQLVGASPSASNSLPVQITTGSAFVSGTNPLPVTITSALVGTSVNNYNTAAAVAANGTSNHIYTITSAKTFNGKKIWASASGKLKIEVRVSPDGSTYSSLWVGFNSTANPNISIDLDELVFLESGVGATIEVIRTNEDKEAMDVYSTISGTEV